MTLRIQTPSNRAINTGHNPADQLITLEATEDVKYAGRTLQKGEAVEVSKSEAKRLLTLSKGKLQIRMD